MYETRRTFARILCVVLLCAVKCEQDASFTEHSGGTVIDERVVFTKNGSPYWLRDDLIVERTAEVHIEPGVTIKVEPQVGITVRGILNALGTEDERITLTTKDESARSSNLPDIRLVDGPTILSGRVQLRVNGKWRSVCTNSKNWTSADMETACRQLGFQGGTFSGWYDRQMPVKSRLLFEEPKCAGTESTLLDCDWPSHQMGSGVCDYHPDLGLECLPHHDTPLKFWRGIRFEQALNENRLGLQNTLYMPASLSSLRYVNIYYAGVGRDQNATSALHVEGVPPSIDHLEVVGSAYNGVNITDPLAPIVLNNCTLRSNRGHGLFINSSYGMALVKGCAISDNGGDGVKYVRAEERPEERQDKFGYGDFCLEAVSNSQVYPIKLYAEQSLFMLKEQRCDKVFSTRQGHVLTLDFVRAVTAVNESAHLEVYDGSDFNNRPLKEFAVRNNTRPQSITTTANQIYVKFHARPGTSVVIFFRITSGLAKTYDLNLTECDVSENRGRGVAIDNLRSQIHVHRSSVSKNGHVAGIHVTSGAGEVNVTESRVSFNDGDGINVTYTGGSRNVSRSSISSNRGYGVAVWLNDTRETEYIYMNQTTVVQYTEVYKNLDVGILHGNYCGEAMFNFTGNSFTNCLGDALEVLACWKRSEDAMPPTHLQIGHNRFIGNEKVSLKLYPAINLKANIEYNHFRQGTYGALLIKNEPLEEFNALGADVAVQQNYFLNNTGVFVANLALSPYSDRQRLLFTRNFVKNNKITEPFQPEDGSVSKLNTRSRMAAPVVVGSSNVDIFRNIIENPDSRYEIGSHLEDQSKIINATYNWLGFANDQYVFHRIFHRNDRYNLAKISFIPFLLHNSNPLTTKTNPYQLYVPKFLASNSDRVGGEIEGEEYLSKGEYVVERDITIRPGGKLTIEPGVLLRFPPSIGMMVGGKLEARGIQPDSIKFTLKEEVRFENVTYAAEDGQYDAETEIVEIEPKIPVRLLGGVAETEGRLQVKVNNQWGTVCNYGWTMENAALVCQQLGYVLNPDDWYLERSEVPSAGTAEPVILSNVRCTKFDLDITRCRSETSEDFSNSCDHENDVGLRCYKSSWAGLRFGALAERSDLQFVTVEQAGLLDYATNTFKPALQLDFARQNLENVRVANNFYHGLGVTYSNIYTDDSVNFVKNSEFFNNKGAGVSIKQLGLTLHNNRVENNFVGIDHNPQITNLQQRELAGWFIKNDEETHYDPFSVPERSDADTIEINIGQTKYLVTTGVKGADIRRSYRITCEPGWVLGLQLLNPVENRSTEHLVVNDAFSPNPNAAAWDLKRDLGVFPTTSSAHGVIIDYESGLDAVGGVVLVVTTIRAPVQNVYNRIVKGPVPTLTVKGTTIRNNMVGVRASYYNRYLDELGNHYLRSANESIKIADCDISRNVREALFVHSPHWDLHPSNLSEVTFTINRTTIADNGMGVVQFSRDMRSSNNLFHYVMQDNTVERNKGGGFRVALPYVWKYNENFTHSVFMDNNTFVNNRNFGVVIDGHYAVVNLTKNAFRENKCETGLLAVKGMEKKLLVRGNRFLENNCQFVIEFGCDSQSEILGEVPASFVYNELRGNRLIMSRSSFGVLQVRDDPTFVLGFKGVQKVNVNRNLFAGNTLRYDLMAGIKTARVDNYLNAQENWWGTTSETEIVSRIFDFDDWNDHAVASFRPYLLEEDFLASYSSTYSNAEASSVDVNDLKGRLYQDLTLVARDRSYVIQSDVTVMPNVTLTIHPGVVMEFAPNVGLLVLGTLNAVGYEGKPIVMRPVMKSGNLVTDETLKRRKRRELELVGQENIRLCENRDCMSVTDEVPHEGFLEYFNRTTLQWIPMCDSRFTERNAEVVCRELGFDPLDAFFDFDVRVDFHSNSLSRIWTWPEPLQCKGTERRYEECPVRLNGQQFGHRHRCHWNGRFVFIKCSRRLPGSAQGYWGGVRFAEGDFERRSYSHRIHDIRTHTDSRPQESTMKFVRVLGAGILHNEKSPAVQSVVKSPVVQYVNVIASASHGINVVGPSATMNLLRNEVVGCRGVGVNVVSLFGEGRESEESSFTPLRGMNLPYNLFGFVDVCDTQKEVVVEDRLLVYYKYDNHPVSCVKIFRSAFAVKPVGMRFLQFNLFNSSVPHGIPDFVSLHDGDIYNVSSKLIDVVTMTSGNDRKLFKSGLPSLSVKLFANGASSDHGFVAEIVTLPISAIAFNRDVQHNISSSVISNNTQGALLYVGAGEVNPIITIERNQFRDNCRKLYGNFSTCRSAIEIDVQNTQTVFFRSNLVERNQGGLYIKADSRGSATAMQGWIHNNLFVNNSHLPTLYVEGRQSSPYQEVTVYRNYFTRNRAEYHNNIVLKRVVSNFTYNYVKRNVGLQNLEVSGFDRVRLNVYQTTTHNGFYNNYAIKRETKSTIVAGTAGQHYVDNIFFDPDNDYEIITVNRSLTFQLWDTKIDAAYNYWGFNTTLAVRGRVKDQSDDPTLLEVISEPFYMNNRSILGSKCPPGWDLVGETCYMYVGAPMTFREAKSFCQTDNASMPYLVGNINYMALYDFLRRQYQWHLYSDRVWVQHIDRINECTIFAYQTVEVDDCERRSPFICEIDPKVTIRILPLANDTVTLAVFGSLAVALVLIAIVIAFWWSKSKYRKAQRLERRNSIRQSLHSLRSVGLPPGSFNDPGYRKKASQMSTRSTDTLTKNSDYKKIVSNGSIDSMEKYNSSIDDSTSYETTGTTTTNPNPSAFAYLPEYQKSPSRFDNQYAGITPPRYDLAFRNEGFKDTSTFGTASRADSLVQEDNGYYYDSDTLPLRDDVRSNGLVGELKAKLPKPPTPPRKYSPTYSERLQDLKYSPDFNTVGLAHHPDHLERSKSADFDGEQRQRKGRAKSEALLETNFDYVPKRDDDCALDQNRPNLSKSKSQPLETAM
ncbi:protein bark beetle isoform X2 [Cylas formicarius]|uniref:protein bark beetle isoform X2 n=1 Tax=Cylas formicarius TaxID=197179 RepID=UPI00295865CD|nr:protein bark beetle isoform X2 [Cylas formicarius]